MLAKVLVGIGILAFVLAVIAIVAGAWSEASWLLGIGLAFAVSPLVERWRYKRDDTVVNAGWEDTGERFIDPETEILMMVYYDPQSGQRFYVPVKKNSDQI